jgi:hypothetical protein
MEGKLTLIARHDPASHARYQELKQLARAQRRILPGAPGTLKRRTRGGTEYWVREYRRPDGRKDDEHLGTVASVPAARIDEARAEIELAQSLVAGSSTLRLFGYQRVERRAAAVLAALFNQGLFSAGLTLVGSHAYGALLNELALAAAGYATQDIDLARAQPLDIALPAEVDFPRLLDASGLRFVPVPGMPARRPSASFKLPGANALAVDLLVPGKRAGELVAVSELRTHAQSIPFLDFLVRQPIDAVILAPNHVVPVKIPAPERFVLHKLYASQARTAERAKVRKDLQQASVIAAALVEDTPGLLEDTWRKMPAAGRSLAARGARAAANLLGESHAPVRDALEGIAR